jgi:hypothetical protein
MEVHIYNPSYSEGRGRKISSSRPAQAKVSKTLTQNKIQTKKLEGCGSNDRGLA